MGTNSVRDNLSKDDVISEIKLLLGADINKHHTFLILEGQDDIKLWKHLCHESTIIYESFSGKEGVSYIVKEYFSNNNRVVGIQDKDYEIGPGSSKLFFYDFSCMEMMLVAESEVFNSVFYEFYSGNLKTAELRLMLLSQLYPLSLIRQNNAKYSWMLQFKGLSLANAFVQKTNSIDIKQIFLQLNNMNTCFFKKNPGYENDIISLKDKPLDAMKIMDIVQGHDFSTLFALVCNNSIRKPRKKGISYENIETGLRCAYNETLFHKTNLYHSIMTYQEENKLSIVI